MNNAHNLDRHFLVQTFRYVYISHLCPWPRLVITQVTAQTVPFASSSVFGAKIGSQADALLLSCAHMYAALYQMWVLASIFHCPHG